MEVVSLQKTTGSMDAHVKHMNSPGYAPVSLALAQTTEDNLVEVGVGAAFEMSANHFHFVYFSSDATCRLKKL